MSIHYTIKTKLSQKDKKNARMQQQPLQNVVNDCNLASASKNSPGRDHCLGFAYEFDNDRAIASGITSFFHCGCEKKINPNTKKLYTRIYPCTDKSCNGPSSCNYCHHRR